MNVHIYCRATANPAEALLREAAADLGLTLAGVYQEEQDTPHAALWRLLDATSPGDAILTLRAFNLTACLKAEGWARFQQAAEAKKLTVFTLDEATPNGNPATGPVRWLPGHLSRYRDVGLRKRADAKRVARPSRGKGSGPRQESSEAERPSPEASVPAVAAP